MPYKKRYSSNYQRKQKRIAKYGKYARPSGAVVRHGYRKGVKGVQKIYAPRFHNPFSKDYEMVQLKYSELITMNPTVDSLTTGNGTSGHQFSFNNLWDLNWTGIGGQPMYRDNYAQVFDKYKVSFAKIKITVVNHSVNTAVWNGSAVVAQPNSSYRLAILRDIDSSDYPSNMEALLQQNASNCKWRYVAPQLNGRLPTLSMKCAPHKTAGVSYGDDTLTADQSNPPAKNVKASIFIVSGDGITDPPEVRLRVEMTYYVKFFDRKSNQTLN